MKMFRDLKWKLIDRFLVLDRKEHYRRAPQTIDAYRVSPKLDPLSAVAVGMMTIVVMVAGVFAVGVGLLILWAIVTA
jgi:preprotein translocase subunit Sec61beta